MKYNEQAFQAALKEDRMNETTETTPAEGKTRKPMSQEQKDAISKTLKAKWRKRRAEQGAVGTLPAPAKKKSKAKPKQALAPATGADARAAVERYNATVKAAKEELRAALRRAIEEL